VRLGHKYKILTERFDVPTTEQMFVKRQYRIFGGNGEEETPVPIPNTAVKLFSADGTAREAEWESRSLPKIPLSQYLFKARNFSKFRAFLILLPETTKPIFL
jgi:hypothetical protein